jgi:hypothetical protein
MTFCHIANILLRMRKQKVVHVHARPNEWVCVHRPHGGGSSNDFFEGIILKVLLYGAAFFVIMMILKALLPFIILAIVALIAFAIFLGKS